jgi:hypothetical protein
MTQSRAKWQEAKMPKTNVLERLDYLSRELEQPVESVMAKAIEVGVASMYRHCMGDKYMAGAISRETALRLLGPQEVARLECVISRSCEAAEDEMDLICGHA